MRVRTFCKLGIAIGLSNYVLYAVISLMAGGDALHGQVAGGHYFLDVGGSFVEVSRALFLSSRWGAYSLLLTFPFGLLCACLLSPTRKPEEPARRFDTA
jgi:hypothetical protein